MKTKKNIVIVILKSMTIQKLCPNLRSIESYQIKNYYKNDSNAITLY